LFMTRCVVTKEWATPTERRPAHNTRCQGILVSPWDK